MIQYDPFLVPPLTSQFRMKFPRLHRRDTGNAFCETFVILLIDSRNVWTGAAYGLDDPDLFFVKYSFRVIFDYSVLNLRGTSRTSKWRSFHQLHLRLQAWRKNEVRCRETSFQGIASLRIPCAIVSKKISFVRLSWASFFSHWRRFSRMENGGASSSSSADMLPRKKKQLKNSPDHETKPSSESPLESMTGEIASKKEYIVIRTNFPHDETQTMGGNDKLTFFVFNPYLLRPLVILLHQFPPNLPLAINPLIPPGFTLVMW